MPELPEVEYARRQLHRAMHGARIERVLARRPDLRYPLGDDFVRRLERRQIRAVRRRAKYLLVDLSSGDVLLMHLGMTGSFRVVRQGPEEEALAHDHVVFEMSSGRAVVFNDPRRFGQMTIVAAGERPPGSVQALGPEPLSKTFDARVLARALRGKKTSLKAALSDQRVVAGLGNIYVSEALHEARLSPTRPAGTLVTRAGEPREGAAALVTAIRRVLQKAIRQQARYRGDDDRFRVYDREGLRCQRRECPGRIRRIVQAGRSTFYCPVCQR